MSDSSVAHPEIVVWPAKVLSEPTKLVTDFGAELHALVERMKWVMAEAKGVGLAANQLGVPLRAAVVKRPDTGAVFTMVNPKIVGFGERTLLDEGCLSIPYEQEKVDRAHTVTVVYQLPAPGQPICTEIAEGRLAHIIQHEVDHLDGLVYADRVNHIVRDRLRLRMKQYKRSVK